MESRHRRSHSKVQIQFLLSGVVILLYFYFPSLIRVWSPSVPQMVALRLWKYLLPRYTVEYKQGGFFSYHLIQSFLRGLVSEVLNTGASN